MYTPGDRLKLTFDRAHKSYREICEGNTDALHRLNKEVLEWDLGARAVVLALDPSDLHPASLRSFDSHFLPQGRLGGFGVLADESKDPELVAVLQDIRGKRMGVSQITLWGQETPVDVETELHGSNLFERIMACLAPGDLLFDELVRIIRDIPIDNLSLATFAAGMNDAALPGTLLTSVYVPGDCADFIVEGSSTMAFKIPAFYPVDVRDVYRIVNVGSDKRNVLLISNMTPGYWGDDHREILIYGAPIGYDLA